MIVGLDCCHQHGGVLTLWFWVVHRELIAKRKAPGASWPLAQNHLRARDGPDELCPGISLAAAIFIANR